MKLKTNQFFFLKRPRIKIKNQKNEDWSGNPHKLEDNSKTLHDCRKLWPKKREKREKKNYLWQTMPPITICAAQEKKRTRRQF